MATPHFNQNKRIDALSGIPFPNSKMKSDTVFLYRTCLALIRGTEPVSKWLHLIRNHNIFRPQPRDVVSQIVHRLVQLLAIVLKDQDMNSCARTGCQLVVQLVWNCHGYEDVAFDALLELVRARKAVDDIVRYVAAECTVSETKLEEGVRRCSRADRKELARYLHCLITETQHDGPE